MHHQEFSSPAELQDTIKCFWYNQKEFGNTPSDFEVVPDGFAEIIFHFGSLAASGDEGDLQPLPSPFLMGLLNQPVLFYATGRLEIIGVRCFPWTVFDLLGLPSGKDEVHRLAHPIAQLQPVLAALIKADKIDEAVAAVKRYFLDERSQPAVDRVLFKAGVALTEASGSLAVSQVAAAAHATVRTLERKFKQSAGHSVKDVASLMRFEQVRNRLWLQPDSTIAALALELGYTDQSHLSKEFKRYSGVSPGAFARKAKKGKQVAGSDFVAFVQA